MTERNTQLVQKKDFITYMTESVKEQQLYNGLEIPRDYSVSNALQSAFLILQETKDKNNQLVLESCSKPSIKNAILSMIAQGLNPIKNQCYFIPYGNQLQLSRSYLGTIAMTKRVKGVKDIKGYAIYKSDKLELGFDFLTGRTTLKEYVPTLNRSPEDIIGGLGLVIGDNEILHVEYMDISQIKNAWNMGNANGKSKAHNNFSDQMVIKTVINRACKLFVNTADDTDKIADFMNRTMDDTDRDFAVEVQENANKKVLEVAEPIELKNKTVDPETGEILEERIEINEEQKTFLNSPPF